MKDGFWDSEDKRNGGTQADVVAVSQRPTHVGSQAVRVIIEEGAVGAAHVGDKVLVPNALDGGVGAGSAVIAKGEVTAFTSNAERKRGNGNGFALDSCWRLQDT